jgi:TonB family protein
MKLPSEVRREVRSAPASDSTRELTAEKPKLVYTPYPPYPLLLDKRRVTGSGRFKITFDERGNAKSVKIIRSPGNHTLDSNTINTLKLWRGAPGSPCYIVVPVDYRQNRQSLSRPQANTSQPHQSRGPQPQPSPLNFVAERANLSRGANTRFSVHCSAD